MGQARAVVARLLGRLSPAREWLAALHACFRQARTFGLAAETAFWLFLSLVPLAAVGGLLAARLSVKHWEQIDPLLASLPPAAHDLVATEVLRVSRWDGGAVGVTGTLVFVWLASNGLHAIFDALEIGTAAARPWWKKRVLAITTCLLLAVAIPVLALLGPGLEGALAWMGRVVPGLPAFGEPTMGGRLLRFAGRTAITFAYTCGLYWVGVHPVERARLPILPGALVAVGMQAVLGFLYRLYIAHAGSGTAYSAGLAIIGVTLTALYLLALGLLTGAAVNRTIAMVESRARASPHPHSR